ncbi:TPA: AAA family ATPase, partial [Citrobacter freundii]|nr:AAA family ATPase [Citrobacter freundii]EIJ8981144.1 AAA family ATPase [Citrobacter freundii]EJD5387837.1 AAA family ATPase [Citrobacter freundii]EJG9717878.1 AAA family ATPase [Citrobacter freundii]EJK5503579.1 AAA family ATPase [Citrobacter freundii]
MLDRIQKITSVGLFNDVSPVGISFRKTSLIYGDNGRGKSTLASIMRSYTSSAPQILINRKTLDTTLAQIVDLQFSGGRRAKFENDVWGAKYSDFHVFDLDFIDTNVYSGGEIRPGHRQKLLTFALGQSAVTAKAEFDAASQNAANCTRLKREVEARLTGYRGQATLSQYIRLRNLDNIDELIAANVAEQGKSQRIDLIKGKNKLKKLTEFTVSTEEFFKIMYKTVEKIDEKAGEIVKSHFEHFTVEGGEKWISEGQKFLVDDTCPFCEQNVDGIDLINAY